MPENKRNKGHHSFKEKGTIPVPIKVPKIPHNENIKPTKRKNGLFEKTKNEYKKANPATKNKMNATDFAIFNEPPEKPTKNKNPTTKNNIPKNRIIFNKLVLTFFMIVTYF